MTRIADSEPAEEEEKFSLTVGFVARMRKQSTTLEGEATSSSGEKRPRQSPSYEGAQKDWAIVSVESPYLASNDQPALGVYLNKANTPLEEGVSTASPPNVEDVGMGAPSGVVIAPAPSPMSIGVGLSKKRLLDQVCNTPKIYHRSFIICLGYKIS